MRGFPWWFGIVVAGVHFRHVTTPVAAALLLFGWYCGPGGLRWICLSAGILLTLPLLMAGLMYVLQSTEEARRWRTLAHAEATAGIELPAVHGRPLSSRDFRLHDDKIIAELAEPFLVGGEMLPAGTILVLDLPSGDVIPRW